MKITGSLNIQNHNWNGIKNHVDRHFEDEKNGTHRDVNEAHINQSLSKYDSSSEGIIEDSHGHKMFARLPNQYVLDASFQQSLDQTYSTYIKKHNQKKSVKRHPKRKITNLYQQKLLKPATKRDKKLDPTAQTKLDAYQKTLVQNIGNTDLNQSIIHQIMKHKHWSYIHARNTFLQASSQAGLQNILNITNRHPHLHLLGYATNVDETSDKRKRKPDAVHTHFSLIGTSFTKLDDNFNPKPATTSKDKHGKIHHHRGAKPSFSFARAVCQDERIPYRKKTIKVPARNKNGYKRVNASYHKALTQFRIQEGQSQIRILNQVLEHSTGMNFHLTYYQTGQKENGLSMEQERHRQNQKHIQQKQAKRNRQLGAKRARHIRNYSYRLAQMHVKNHKKIAQQKKNLQINRSTHSSLVAKNSTLRASNYSIQQSQVQAKSKAQSIISGARSEVEKFHTSAYGSLVASVTSVELNNNNSLSASYHSASLANSAELSTSYQTTSQILSSSAITKSSALDSSLNSHYDSANQSHSNSFHTKVAQLQKRINHDYVVTSHANQTTLQNTFASQSNSLSNQANTLSTDLERQNQSQSINQSQSLSIYGISLTNSINSSAKNHSTSTNNSLIATDSGLADAVQASKNKYSYEAQLRDLSLRKKKQQEKKLDNSVNHEQITLDTLKKQFSAIQKQFRSYKQKLNDFTQNVIKSTRQTLKQNAQQYQNNLHDLSSANTKSIHQATQKIQHEASKSRTGLFGGIKKTFSNFKSNYQSNKSSQSASQSVALVKHQQFQYKARHQDENNSENPYGYAIYLENYPRTSSEQADFQKYQSSVASNGTQLTSSELVNWGGIADSNDTDDFTKGLVYNLAKHRANQSGMTLSQSATREQLQSSSRRSQAKSKNQAVDQKFSNYQKTSREQAGQRDRARNRWISKHPDEAIKQYNQNHSGPSW